jgi:hypothetical protein
MDRLAERYIWPLSNLDFPITPAPNFKVPIRQSTCYVEDSCNLQSVKPKRD